MLYISGSIFMELNTVLALNFMVLTVAAGSGEGYKTELMVDQ